MDYEHFGESVSTLIEQIVSSRSTDCDLKRDNANINGDTAMGSMLQIGANVAKEFYLDSMVPPAAAQAHRSGDIHIHDLDFYGWTTTCTQIDLLKLFEGGFDTGHGHLREPKSIRSYAALAAIAIQSNQNDQHGGQSIVNFDYSMAKGVQWTYERMYHKYKRAAEENSIPDVHSWVHEQAIKDTQRETYQAMEGFIHNLNTMHSRAGAQVPFSSINYGMDTSWAGRMAVEQLLLATEAGLGNGETPIFPIQIFRVKEGVNFNPGDPNYDLYRLAIRVSAKRLFPNFSFVDAPFNKQYYKEGNPDTEIAYMGCRTRVIGNVHDPDRQICPGRGNLSFTSINLPRIAILSGQDEPLFYRQLDHMLDLVADQLLSRLQVQSQRIVANFPFLMGQGVWIDSDSLHASDSIAEVLKHGTLSIGFIGLAETLKSLYGAHHGEDELVQSKGLQIVQYIREFCDWKSQETGLNFTCLATPAEGLSGRFVRMDRERFGTIEGVTDREYYTNSFHVPVYYPINAYRKLAIEAPYHALTNAGHISYVEMDGDPTKNLDAFEKLVRYMHDVGIGYGSINHPVDRDPVCGFNGVIGDTCPKCGRTEDTHAFERIRRITGYLVGTLDRWNSAKRAEESQRVKHHT